MKKNLALELILKALNNKRKETPKFSIRLLATRIGISNGYLSKILSGKNKLSTELAMRLSNNLHMDDLQKEQLAKALGFQTRSIESTETVPLAEYELAPAGAEWILSKWYITAVLDLITCEDFQPSDVWIANRLEILPAQAREALVILERVGLITRDEVSGSLRKKYGKIRFPTKVSKSIIRDFHLVQMKRAAQLMNLRNSQSDFDARLITGLTVASNPKKIKEAKEILHAALYEVANLLAEGPCTEVFQINLQFFPHTKKRN